MNSYCPLGAFRLLLALLVFCAHTVTIYDPLRWIWPYLPFEQANIGVWGFFIVSGYIVTRAAHTHYLGNAPGFVANRALRIYPAFLVAYTIPWLVLIALGVEKLDPVVPPGIFITGLSWSDYFKGISIFGAWNDQRAFLPNTPVWSIFVEAVFYGVVCLILILRRGVWVAATIAIVLFFAPPFFEEVGGHALSGVPGPFKYTPFFLVGVSLFAVQKKVPYSVLGLAVSYVLTLFFVFGVHQVLYMPNGTRFDDTTYANAVAITIAIGGLWTLSRASVSSRIDKFLGDLTYPLYLCHVPILAILWTFPHKRGLWAWSVSLALCLVVSWLIVVLVERPIYRIRDRIRRVNILEPRITPAPHTAN